jgi:hypothetical protein
LRLAKRPVNETRRYELRFAADSLDKTKVEVMIESLEETENKLVARARKELREPDDCPLTVITSPGV